MIFFCKGTAKIAIPKNTFAIRGGGENFYIEFFDRDGHVIRCVRAKHQGKYRDVAPQYNRELHLFKNMDGVRFPEWSKADRTRFCAGISSLVCSADHMRAEMRRLALDAD